MFKMHFKLFRFHGIFKTNEVKSAKRTHHKPLSRNPGSAPAVNKILFLFFFRHNIRLDVDVYQLQDMNLVCTSSCTLS